MLIAHCCVTQNTVFFMKAAHLGRIWRFCASMATAKTLICAFVDEERTGRVLRGKRLTWVLHCILAGPPCGEGLHFLNSPPA